MTEDERPDTKPDDPRLLSIAKALADGLPVDWQEGDDDEELERMKARLRFVETVAEAHRRLLREETPPAEKKSDS